MVASYKPDAMHQKLDMVGSSTFGRDPKILASRTFNMIIADDWLVDYCGYKNILHFTGAGQGRGIFTNIKSNTLICVVGSKVFSVYVFSESLSGVKSYESTLIGVLDTNAGDVYIEANITNQIAICDQKDLWIYNYVTGDFTKAILPTDVVPGYVTYQNGRFGISDIQTSQWFLSAVGNGLDWFPGASGEPYQQAIQTKPDLAEAVVRFPGRGNLLLVMGNTVTELWTDVGDAVFPYQKSTSLNYDYGCVNAATIATSGEIVVWLGLNEKSGPVIMYSTGSDVQQISTDGINYKFQNLKFPQKSVGFLMKLSGHLIYQLTFYDPNDNYSLIYDFTTNKFFDVTDENMNYHIARRVAYYDNDYFFVSLNDNNLYKLDVDSTTFDYGLFEDGSPKIYEIPRIRICENFRLPNSSRFIINNVTFLLEQGNDPNYYADDPDYKPRIGLSISVDGGYSYSGFVTKPIYHTAKRRNKIDWWNLGSANDFVPQFRFWGKGPWKAFDGLMLISQ